VIEISVRNINLVGFEIDFRVCWTAKTSGVIAVCLRPRFADLESELACASEFQILSVIFSITSDPDEASRINADTVLILRPLISLAGTAPSSD
jgi:hypothetical protein